jgi:hypothetical protein
VGHRQHYSSGAGAGTPPLGSRHGSAANPYDTASITGPCPALRSSSKPLKGNTNRPSSPSSVGSNADSDRDVNEGTSSLTREQSAASRSASRPLVFPGGSGASKSISHLGTEQMAWLQDAALTLQVRRRADGSMPQMSQVH